MKSEIYSYENKVSLDKCNQMLDILVSFYNDLNGKENNTKEMRDTWINMVRNTKDYFILLFYKDSELLGFINYMYLDYGLMLSEIQISKYYQDKKYLKAMLKELINSLDRKVDNIYASINSKNIKSKQVFTHIGFMRDKNILYKISYNDLLKWINN